MADRPDDLWIAEGVPAPIERLRLLLDQCCEARPRPLAAPGERPTVSRARDFIHEHVADGITLRDIVEASGSASQFQLIRDFTAAVGVPPHAYQIQLRVAKARDLLAAGVPPIEVAAELGFTDQSHLSRHFRRVLGVTPGAFARATGLFRISATAAAGQRPGVAVEPRVAKASWTSDRILGQRQSDMGITAQAFHFRLKHRNNVQDSDEQGR